MISQLSFREGFNLEGLRDAAPDFPVDYLFYQMRNMWGSLSCFPYAMGYKQNDFGRIYDQVRALPDYHETTVGITETLARTNATPIKNNDLLYLPEGHYPVAGFIDPEIYSGYKFKKQHWYRLDKDLLWSHKLNWDHRSCATKLDASENFIEDPRRSNRKFGNNDYSCFIGFYAVPKGGATFGEKRLSHYDAIEQHIHDALAQWKRRHVLKLV